MSNMSEKRYFPIEESLKSYTKMLNVTFVSAKTLSSFSRQIESVAPSRVCSSENSALVAI